MVIFLPMLGGSGLSIITSKVLFNAQVEVIELAMAGGIIRTARLAKRKLPHSSAILFTAGTILVSIGAAAY
jgi:hypothetical protein